MLCLRQHSISSWCLIQQCVTSPADGDYVFLYSKPAWAAWNNVSFWTGVCIPAKYASPAVTLPYGVFYFLRDVGCLGALRLIQSSAAPLPVPNTFLLAERIAVEPVPGFAAALDTFLPAVAELALRSTAH